MKKILLLIGIFVLLIGGAYMVVENNKDNEEILRQEAAESNPYANPSFNDPRRKASADNIGVRVSNIAMDFVLSNLDGEEESLWSYRGNRVVLNFWASWCPPCKEEMPDLNRFYHNYKDDNIVVIGVNLGENPKDVQRFMDEGGYDFPILLDQEQLVGLYYGVRFMPTTFFIDEEGVIMDIHVGPLREEELKRKLNIK